MARAVTRTIMTTVTAMSTTTSIPTITLTNRTKLTTMRPGLSSLAPRILIRTPTPRATITATVMVTRLNRRLAVRPPRRGPHRAR